MRSSSVDKCCEVKCELLSKMEALSEMMNIKTCRRFNGKDPEKFQAWWMEFYAFAENHGFEEALKPEFMSQLPASQAKELDELNPEDKKKIKARKMNALAMSYLMQLLDGPLTQAPLFQVQNEYEETFPNGVAWRVMQLLKKRWDCTDSDSAVEMQLKLSAMKLKPNEDPLLLFEQMYRILHQTRTRRRVG